LGCDGVIAVFLFILNNETLLHSFSINNLSNGFQFLKEMKLMLKMFYIDSTKTWIMNGNRRKDNKITKGMYFKIKQNRLVRFGQQIGFNDKFKNKRLILVGRMGRCS